MGDPNRTASEEEHLVPAFVTVHARPQVLAGVGLAGEPHEGVGTGAKLRVAVLARPELGAVRLGGQHLRALSRASRDGRQVGPVALHLPRGFTFECAAVETVEWIALLDR